MGCGRIGRSWKAAGQSAASGAVLGALFGWLFGLFDWVNPLISGLLLFIPLGAVVLFRARRRVNRRAFRAGVIIGFLMHVAVVLLAFGFARINA